MFFKQNNSTAYQLTDHLGNVRAVVSKEGKIDSSTDYYPFGMAMPNRNTVDANGYRYGYQGEFAETDKETGMPAFQLRLYDTRIGRWISPDPYGQYSSPYLAMGNRPNMLVDPDGGCVDENGNPCVIPGGIGGTALDGGGNQWSWDGETWNTDFAFGLNEVMVSGQGNGLSGVAGVRFEQYSQIIGPDITRRKAEWKGAYALALSPFAVIGAIEGAALAASNLPTFSSTSFVFSGEATVAGTESLYTYQTQVSHLDRFTQPLGN